MADPFFTRASISISIAILCLLNGRALHAAGEKPLAPKRIEVHISNAERSKLKDLSQSLQMASITPIINDKDEVICMSIGAIHDKRVSQTLKAEVGDRFSDVKVFKKSTDGKMTSEIVSVLSPSDAMMLYQALVGASRVDVDLKRKKKIVPMTYLMD